MQNDGYEGDQKLCAERFLVQVHMIHGGNKILLED